MQTPKKREFQSEFARKYTTLGRVEGEASAILRILAKRGLGVSDEQRNRILACTDLAVLETWLDRAIVATSVDEVIT